MFLCLNFSKIIFRCLAGRQAGKLMETIQDIGMCKLQNAFCLAAYWNGNTLLSWI